MGRWADKNNDKITDAILALKTNPDAALRTLQSLAAEATKHDQGDAEVMRKIAEGHAHLAG